MKTACAAWAGYHGELTGYGGPRSVNLCRAFFSPDASSMPFRAADDTSEWLPRLQRGDADALAEVYDALGSTVYAVAVRVLGQRDEAEEVVQDTFRTLWTHARTLGERPVNLRAWLVTAARRRAIDGLRKRQRRILPATALAETERDPTAAVVAEDAGAGEALETQETIGRVRSALADLPSEQTEVVQLAFFSGLTHQEIAERLALPLGTIKSRLRYALSKLRGKLGGGHHD